MAKLILGNGPRQVREAHVAHIPEDRLTNGVALARHDQR